MTRFGYTLMTEQNGPNDLVAHAVSAEGRGFDFAVCSDHFSPWLTAQGHAPNAWAVLGAVAHATERIGLYSFVTCPTLRYHPALVAQQAATVQLLSDGRFTLGLGSGENLNEHVIGAGWPAVADRHEMLAEAVEIIRALFSGETVDHRGAHFRLAAARLWDLPAPPVGIGIALSGAKGVARLAELSDHLIAVRPDPELVRAWREVRRRAGRSGDGRVIGQLPVCWDPDRDRAIERAHRQFRWAGLGWPIMADLPTPAAFAAASRFVRPSDVAAGIPCGPDLGRIVDAARAFRQAGFTDIALLQIGGESQQQFLDEAAEPLLAALHAEMEED